MLTDVNSLRFRKELSVSWEQGFTYNKAGVYKGWVIKGEGCHGGYDGRGGGMSPGRASSVSYQLITYYWAQMGFKIENFLCGKKLPIKIKI